MLKTSLQKSIREGQNTMMMILIKETLVAKSNEADRGKYHLVWAE